MAEQPFTPGPWSANVYGPHDVWVRDAKGDPVCHVGANQRNAQADARLIAAAPSLHAALKTLVDECHEAIKTEEWDSDNLAYNEAARLVYPERYDPA